jgi:nitroreductase
MDALNCILTRRSIRKYTGKPVDDARLQTILRAGMSAPTAMNTRPWQFVVVRSTETLEAITKAHPYSKMLPGAARSSNTWSPTQARCSPGPKFSPA